MLLLVRLSLFSSRSRSRSVVSLRRRRRSPRLFAAARRRCFARPPCSAVAARSPFCSLLTPFPLRWRPLPNASRSCLCPMFDLVLPRARRPTDRARSVFRAFFFVVGATGHAHTTPHHTTRAQEPTRNHTTRAIKKHHTRAHAQQKPGRDLFFSTARDDDDGASDDDENERQID